MLLLLLIASCQAIHEEEKEPIRWRGEDGLVQACSDCARAATSEGNVEVI